MRNIKDYAAMCKLSLPEEEAAWVEGRVKILALGFDELRAVDTSGVTPLVTVLDIKNVMREDVAVKHIPREDLLAGAPQEYDGYFQVPKTVG